MSSRKAFIAGNITFIVNECLVNRIDLAESITVAFHHVVQFAPFVIGFAVAEARFCRNEFRYRHLFARFGYWRGDLCHGCFGQLAAVSDLPFVVGFDQDCAGEAFEYGAFESTRRRRRHDAAFIRLWGTPARAC